VLVLDVTYAHPDWPPYHFMLEARAGEVTAITGPSGSGKSTLLDLIAGFLTPATGHIRLDGADLVPLTPEQRPISILFQSDNVFEHLTPARNVALGLPAATPAAERNDLVAKALQDVDLTGLGNRPTATLSGGQKQRVALARTLLRARPVLLLDEPFSALDGEARMEARNLVRKLTVANRWITLLVTHDEADVGALAARRYVLRDGKLGEIAVS